MREIDASSAEAYLRKSGRVKPRQGVRIRELAGGVSNVVLLVEPEGGAAFVLKQARGRLRVAQPWFCSVERIWREVAVLRICDRVLAATSAVACAESTADVPRLLFEDRENYLYAMSAAPPHSVWKAQLLSGDVRPELAAACGRLLGALHAGTWGDAETARDLDDRRFFIDLRLDPYYRRTADVHPTLRGALETLVASQDAHRRCLVHGDFSPKNLLVHARGVTLVDFEVGHFGDPAFDLGFFLSHLVLKAVHAGEHGGRLLELTETFWSAYRSPLQQAGLAAELGPLERRAAANFAGCVLARIDGKSPVEYLTEERQRKTARAIGTSILEQPCEDWRQSLDTVRQLTGLR